jgi:hypothetical protein
MERLFPEPVAMGVARLTVQNAGVILSAVNADATCGFASHGVLSGVHVEGAVGGPGRATYTVSQCEIDLGAGTSVFRDCTGTDLMGAGRLVVSATRTLEGFVTGNPGQPIIPSGVEAVRMNIDAQLFEFKGEQSNGPGSLTVHTGRLSFGVIPRLMHGKTTGACEIPTPNITFDHVVLSNAQARVATAANRFEVEVATSDLAAQMGTGLRRENDLSGTIQVWDATVTVPTASDRDGLIPGFSRASFEASYACTPDMAPLPLVTTCPSLKEIAAPGIARLTTALAGAMVEELEADTRCGFSSADVKRAATASHAVGQAGTLTYAVSTPCALSFVSRQVPGTCGTPGKFLNGTVVGKGTKVIAGLLTGDAVNPVVPQRTEPATVTVELSFENFTFDYAPANATLFLKKGRLEAQVVPTLALDTALGVCSLQTPIAELTGIRLKDADVELRSKGVSFAFRVDDSSLSAQNGSRRGKSNRLEGSITLNGEKHPIPLAGQPAVLDPSYDEQQFKATYACVPNLKMVDTDEACSLEPTLAAGTARLLTEAVGMAFSVASSDDKCGFSDTNKVLTRPTRVVGSPGQMGSLSWAIQNCEIKEVDSQETCQGGRSYIEGQLRFTGNRTVEGLREEIKIPLPFVKAIQSIVPKTREAVTMEATNSTFSEFSTFTVPSGKSGPARKLTIHSGEFSAKLEPITGEREGKREVYDVGTPVVRLTSIVVKNARVTLLNDGKTFSADVQETQLFAQNGIYRRAGNTLTGFIVFNGRRYDLSALALDPDYNQANFDASYACTKDLLEPVPWQ